MGRATGIKDIFTPVVGNRRGLTEEQESSLSSLSSSLSVKELLKLLSPDLISAQRRFTLLQWMTDKQAFQVAIAVLKSRAYGEVEFSIRTTVCWQDLERLIDIGFCSKVGDDHKAWYRVRPMRDWPEALREAYLEAVIDLHTVSDI